MAERPTLITGVMGSWGRRWRGCCWLAGMRCGCWCGPRATGGASGTCRPKVVVGDLTDPLSLTQAAAGCRGVPCGGGLPDLGAHLGHAARQCRWHGVDDPGGAGRRVERIVYCSSVAALGVTADGSAATERCWSMPGTIVSTYKRSKYEAEQAALALAGRQGAPVVVVNPAAPVGPRDIKPTPTGRMVPACGGRADAGLCRYGAERRACGRRGGGACAGVREGESWGRSISWAART